MSNNTSLINENDKESLNGNKKTSVFSIDDLISSKNSKKLNTSTTNDNIVDQPYIGLDYSSNGRLLSTMSTSSSASPSSRSSSSSCNEDRNTNKLNKISSSSPVSMNLNDNNSNATSFMITNQNSSSSSSSSSSSCSPPAVLINNSPLSTSSSSSLNSFKQNNQKLIQPQKQQQQQQQSPNHTNNFTSSNNNGNQPSPSTIPPFDPASVMMQQWPHCILPQPPQLQVPPMNPLAQPPPPPQMMASHPTQPNQLSPQSLAQMAQFGNMAADPQIYYHLQREQAMNMFRSNARFFDPRFNLPRKFYL